MVYVNSKKFACESCIKGHRSSSCHHTDRPLFEIKKKGRPVSQCTQCRELRQSKKLHSKCTCNHTASESQAVQPLASSSGSKTRRFIPIAPALPNGLRDVLSQSSMSLPADARQRVDSLLNPCTCKSVWKCKCRQTKGPGPSIYEPPAPEPVSGLCTLAQAAAMCCTSSLPISSSRQTDAPLAKKVISRPHPRPESPNYPSSKRQKRDPAYSVRSQGPDLPPILRRTSPPPSTIPNAMPDFTFMPPMSQITSLAGSGCTCGVKCACPGCVKHRGTAHASHEHRDCAEGCGTCVDHSLGIALPSTSSSQEGSSTSFLDRFFARAAALPPPPAHRKMSSIHLDPMNTTVYARLQDGSHSLAFGLVNLPKLECCGGQCKCPNGNCSCRTSCAGSCDHESHPNRMEQSESPAILMEATPPASVLRSCCAGTR